MADHQEVSGDRQQSDSGTAKRAGSRERKNSAQPPAGAAGRLGHDDLRLVVTNITFAIKSLGRGHFSTVLIGGQGLSTGRALRAWLDGICDGLERFDGLLECDPAAEKHFAGVKAREIRLT